MGRKRKSRDADATVELDAVADELEEVALPAHAPSAPPPLPPERASPKAWLAGLGVMLVAAVAAVGIGLLLRPPAPDGGRSPARPTDAASAPLATEGTPLQMEEVVFDDEELLGEEPGGTDTGPTAR